MLRRCLLSLCALAWLVVAGCNQPQDPSNVTTSVPQHLGRTRSATSNPPAGNFDYYLFTLSWSPEYCHGHPNNPQCDGSHPGFVVHGLWPQFNNGGWPSSCSYAVGLSNPDSMLDIMPDPRLIRHEWTTHGTCSGLSAPQYFATVRQAYRSIHIPAPLVSPNRATTRSADQIKQMFVDANPQISVDDIAVSCHNRYLSAVEFCLSKQLQPIACHAVRDCTAASIHIPAAR